MSTRLVALLALAACASAPVSPERVKSEELRLLEPFQNQAGVVADGILFEISANFDHYLTRPAQGGALFEFSKTNMADHDEYRWIGKGGLQAPLHFRLGSMDFAALHSATIRVLRRGRITLRVEATGNVTVSESGQIRNQSSFLVEDGAIHRG